MATAQLRVFPHPEEDQEDSSNPSITIRLSELYPLLAQAYRDNYVWLRDFRRRRAPGQQRSLRGRPCVFELPSVGMRCLGSCLARRKVYC